MSNKLAMLFCLRGVVEVSHVALGLASTYLQLFLIKRTLLLGT